jgi:hypothetical protein
MVTFVGAIKSKYGKETQQLMGKYNIKFETEPMIFGNEILITIKGSGDDFNLFNEEMYKKRYWKDCKEKWYNLSEEEKSNIVANEYYGVDYNSTQIGSIRKAIIMREVSKRDCLCKEE